MVLTALAVVCGLLAAGGGVQLARQLTRHATKAEAAQALSREVASRWERLPAGTIFPATISYKNVSQDTVTARLVGISPAESCTHAVPAAGLAKFKVTGCTTMLRATYIDATGLTAATVGIGVLSGRRGHGGLDQPIAPGDGLHALGYSGTLSAGFDDAGRAAAFAQIDGPYLFLYTAGNTDGAPMTTDSTQNRFDDLGSGIVQKLVATLTGHPSPCTMKDIKC